MLKHLFWYPWLIGALVLGILFCLGMIIYLLAQPVPQPAFFPGAQLVREAMRYAAL